MNQETKPKMFAYKEHRTVDGKKNIIIDAYVSAANLHDSVPYISRMEKIKEKFNIIPKKVGLDKGYFNRKIIIYLFWNLIFFSIPYPRTRRNKSIINKYYFKYDYCKHQYRCPSGKYLCLKTIRNNGMKVYANREGCESCVRKTECVNIKNSYREITRHIDEKWNDYAKAIRLTNVGKYLAKRRKETIEVSFAISKEWHGYKFTRYNGLIKNQDRAWVLCACENIYILSKSLEKGTSIFRKFLFPLSE